MIGTNITSQCYMRFLYRLLRRNHLINILFTDARILLRSLETITLQLSGDIPYFSDNVL